MKVAMCATVLIVDRSADVIIWDAKFNVQESEFGFRDGVNKLESRVKASYEVDVLLQFHAATACNTDVSLVDGS